MVLQHVSSTETSHKESWLKEAQRIESLEDHPGEKPFPTETISRPSEKRVRLSISFLYK
jgi:hypothetical protein